MSILRRSDDDPIPGSVTLTLNDPERANALGADLVEAIEAELDDLTSGDCTALVVRAEGRSFCGGFDLSDVATASQADLLARFVAVERMLERLRGAHCLTVAVAQGPAIGAGADLLAACDYRIGSARSRFRFPGVRFGLLLGTSRLTELVGGQAALNVLLRGEAIDADRALRVGLLTHVADDADVPAIVGGLSRAMTEIPAAIRSELLAITRLRSRSDPMALLVQSASSPGLPDRISEFIGASARARA